MGLCGANYGVLCGAHCGVNYGRFWGTFWSTFWGMLWETFWGELWERFGDFVGHFLGQIICAFLRFDDPTRASLSRNFAILAQTLSYQIRFFKISLGTLGPPKKIFWPRPGAPLGVP